MNKIKNVLAVVVAALALSAATFKYRTTPAIDYGDFPSIEKCYSAGQEPVLLTYLYPKYAGEKVLAGKELCVYVNVSTIRRDK